MITACFKTITPSKMDREAFIQSFGGIYEHSSWVAEGAYQQGVAGEHNQIESLHQLLASEVAAASEPDKLALINAHPDLAGKAAVAGELTVESTSEQASAGISNCSPAEFSQFTELNNAYKTKFNFPFIMAVKGSNTQKILSAFTQRLEHSAAQEFKQALQEIDKIALLRLQEL
ncbi:MAG: 2-oxo-4-hydroxy-4-carboxy-5-ureidoimidazoline decarboxylase [Pseudomonadales bacterium]|nr:2-oxo-4-hydroxy-4-carboxy-5-ureidoimidazoline decarboxylase [Pseudomonadales bacterium]